MRLRSTYARFVAHLLRRDAVVAGSERRFAALLESAPDAIVIVDWHGHIKVVNAEAASLFRWPRSGLVGQSISELIPEASRAVHREHVRGYLRSPVARRMGGNIELLGRRRDGTTFPAEISLGPLETDTGLLISAVIRDLTARKRTEAALDEAAELRRSQAALREAEERFRAAFEEAPAGIALVGLDGQLVQVNRALCAITGHSVADLQGMTLAAITHPDDVPLDQEELRRILDGSSTHYTAERRYVHAAGHSVSIDLSVAVIRDDGGRPRHFLAQVHDITERKRFEGQLQHLADHDALTGMFNRRRFEQELDRELARAIRYGTGGALLAIDLDHFKYVNDALGHSGGDALITRAGGIFRGTLRHTDIMARLGGDEFAVILPKADATEAELVAGNLLAALREDGRITPATDHTPRVTGSIGIALFTDGPMTGEELLVDADIAMYDAKEAGRDRYEIYDRARNRQHRMQARLTWADRIRDALAQDRLVLHAQPILSLGDDVTPRAELLIRMLDDADELILPDTFLYIAERFDLIQEIDRWVIRHAVALLADAKHRGHRIELAVNVSGKSVSDPTLPQFVATTLDGAGINGQGLCVEVTETAAIVNVDRAKGFAHTLRELGCEFALDDFGAGFASFYYLKHMAFDYVKIDGEFIRNLPSSRVNQLVVRSVVDIAKGLGKRTIAEFVGDAQSVELLRRFGVDYAQGFHLARPQSLLAMGLIHPRPATEPFSVADHPERG